jgi:hypothetical protein
MVIEKFVTDLESTLEVCRTEVSLAQAWSCAPPEAAAGATLEEFLDEVSDQIYMFPCSDLLQPGWQPVFYDAYHNLDKFRQDYEKEFAKKPYVNPYNRWKW